jgi:hypothetical protein
MALDVAGELDVLLDAPGRRPVHARVTGAGRRLVVDVDDADAFAGRGDAAAIRAVGAGLAAHDLVLTVVSGGRPLVHLGAVRAGWWQRRLTGSPYARVAGLHGLGTGLRRAAPAREPMLPSAGHLPPATPWPPAPTFLRRRRPVTVTHDPARGGHPRLVLAQHDGRWTASPQPTFALRGLTTLGSDPRCDVVLAGLDPVHAVVRHDDADEFVARAARPGGCRVNGEPVRERILRTGCRLEVGDWVLVFARDEHADHGRPYGGRIGGELGHQRPQPAREELQRR